jgi:hypothetical protein
MDDDDPIQRAVEVSRQAMNEAQNDLFKEYVQAVSEAIQHLKNLSNATIDGLNAISGNVQILSNKLDRLLEQEGKSDS